MDKKKSTATGNPSGEEKTKQSSGTSKDVNEIRRANTRMVQNFLLIWLDNSIDKDGNNNAGHSMTQLRRVTTNIKTFSDGDRCIEFISNITNEKACMIISGSLGQHIVPTIHNMSQIDSIFIFCGNKKKHEQWAKQWPKIKGVFTDITPICEALRQAAQQCEHDAISISFVPMSDGTLNKNLDQLDFSFISTQIFKEILLTIQFEEKHVKVLTDYCRKLFVENDHELENIEKLKGEYEYRKQTPIWWYTYECFLYSMLSRAFRMMDVDIIVRMGFFVNDLHQYIEKLHSEQYSTHQKSQPFIVYRDHGLSKTDFDQMMKTKGALISFNNFLSTSKNPEVSLDFARRNLFNADAVSILFAIAIDPSKSSTPFAYIKNINDHRGTEDEILFSMHTVFRIHDIKQIDENNRLWQVDLTLIGDDDPELRVLTEYIREVTFPDEKGWHRLGQFLLERGQSDKAQQLYNAMLEQTSDDREQATIYNQLGRIKSDQEKYEEAIKFYEKSLEINQRTLAPNHPDLAGSYNNIGEV